MKEYVLGFMFSSDLERVVLIRKNRPEWQKDKLNGVGGKIEVGETSDLAMIREFAEETGFLHGDWTKLGVMRFPEAWVHVFCSSMVDVALVGTCTDEQVGQYSVSRVCLQEDVIPNLSWLIPMAKWKLLGHQWVHEVFNMEMREEGDPV